MRGRRAGITLVELLVAAAIGAIILTLLGGLLGGTRRHATRTELAADTAAALRLSAALLRDELRLAGSAPWGHPASSPGIPDLAAWLDPGLTVVAGGGGHAIAMRGIDHRVVDGARDLLFEAGTDGRGEPQLYRRAAGGTRQPLVAGVEGLRLGWVVTAEGARVEAASSLSALDGLAVAALGLTVVVAGEALEFVAELPARPRLVVGQAR